MLETTVVGHLGKDAVVQHPQNTGKDAIRFTVCHSNEWVDEEGVVHGKTVWVNCTIWKDQGKGAKIAQALKKGQGVALRGIPKASAYIKEGKPVGSLDLNVQKLEFVGKRPETGADPAATTTASSTKKKGFT